MDIDWKNLQIEGLLKIEKLVDEYWINTYFSTRFIRFRVYEREDNSFYAVAGITIKNPQTCKFVRPYGEGTNSYQAFHNAVIHSFDLAILLNEELSDSNYVESTSNEY